MIRLSKLREEDNDLLVFDVRPKAICEERGTEVKVYLGRIVPTVDSDGYQKYLWRSRWGFNRGESYSVEIAQQRIEECAKGMYI